MSNMATLEQFDALGIVAGKNPRLAEFLRQVAKNETVLVKDLVADIEYLGFFNALESDGLLSTEHDEENISGETRVVFTPLGQDFYNKYKDKLAESPKV